MPRNLCIAFLLASTAGTVGAQVLNRRTGGWELTVRKTPAVGEVTELKTRMCLRKEDLDADAVFRSNEDAENCKTTRGTRTATRLTYTIVCTGEDASRSSFELVAKSPETLTIKATTEGVDAGTAEVAGRFASAGCQGFEN
jgi:hypothetical protein